MKDYIKKVIDNKKPLQDNTNYIREYIQKFLLYILYKKKIYLDLVFVGGTALRFLYQIRRFSENLDFSLSCNVQKYDFKNILNTIKKELIAAGYEVEIKYKLNKNVHSALLKFPGLLFEYGLSPHKEERISIKMEIDTNPPHEGKEKLDLFNSIFIFYIHHYDLPSLFAGKLHAILCREYTKGRDWYDLLWYMTKFKNLEPNFKLLNNAIKQKSKKPFKINKENWKNKLMEYVSELDIKQVADDIKRFLEEPEEIKLLTKENLYKMLR